MIRSEKDALSFCKETCKKYNVNYKLEDFIKREIIFYYDNVDELYKAKNKSKESFTNQLFHFFYELRDYCNDIIAKYPEETSRAENPVQFDIRIFRESYVERRVNNNVEIVITLWISEYNKIGGRFSFIPFLIDLYVKSIGGYTYIPKENKLDDFVESNEPLSFDEESKNYKRELLNKMKGFKNLIYIECVEYNKLNVSTSFKFKVHYITLVKAILNIQRNYKGYCKLINQQNVKIDEELLGNIEKYDQYIDSFIFSSQETCVDLCITKYKELFERSKSIQWNFQVSSDIEEYLSTL